MYREVTMIEIREVLRLRGEGLPKKRIAAQLGLDPKTVRRYLDGRGDRRRPRDGDDQRRGGPPGPPRAAARRRSAARRRVGAVSSSSAPRSSAGSVTACASRRFASCSSGKGSRSRIPRCTASRSSSCSLGRRRRRSRCSMASPARSCRSIRAGSAGSRCPSGNGDGFAPGSLPRCARGTASSIPPSRKRPRAPSRRVKPRGSFSAAFSRS